jgi:excisionase family DNA binding protein
MGMANVLYSAMEVADILGLHVRTVRSYVREGKLKAVRVGKQYRIAAHDLMELTGDRSGARLTDGRNRHVEVSSIVEIDAVDPILADRVSTGLTGAAQGRDKAGIEEALRIQVIYYPERARLKIIVSGGMHASTQVLGLVNQLLEVRS